MKLFVENRESYMNKQKTMKTCSEKRYEVLLSDLPLSCPNSNMELWDSHPKVYLDIDGTGEVMCPYCGALYVSSG